MWYERSVATVGQVRRRRWRYVAVVAILTAAAIVPSVGVTRSGEKPSDAVTLQLTWETQARFAGYYAALAKGYYRRAGLKVTIRPGGPNVVPERVVTGGRAEIGIDWLPTLLAARDRGGDIVNIGQIFTRSGVTELTWKDSGISSFCGLRHKRVGVWVGGTEAEQFAALEQCGIDPSSDRDVRIVDQPLDMNPFLARHIDAASAMTYNELAQVLETKNPKTGKLYQRRDLNVFSMQALGTGMLEDGIFVRGDWLKIPRNKDIARRFLEASLEGWVYCRDHPKPCVGIVLRNAPKLGRGHETWQLNEVNKLIWPARLGIGVMDPVSYRRTTAIARSFKIVRKRPVGAYVTIYAREALADLRQRGLDVRGRSYRPRHVQVTLGGK
jgi:NitT/TauT family transport system substrate-binding protein